MQGQTDLSFLEIGVIVESERCQFRGGNFLLDDDNDKDGENGAKVAKGGLLPCRRKKWQVWS